VSPGLPPISIPCPSGLLELKLEITEPVAGQDQFNFPVLAAVVGSTRFAGLGACPGVAVDAVRGVFALSVPDDDRLVSVRLPDGVPDREAERGLPTGGTSRINCPA
jgi:hypothetical protein